MPNCPRYFFKILKQFLIIIEQINLYIKFHFIFKIAPYIWHQKVSHFWVNFGCQISQPRFHHAAKFSIKSWVTSNENLYQKFSPTCLQIEKVFLQNIFQFQRLVWYKKITSNFSKWPLMHTDANWLKINAHNVSWFFNVYSSLTGVKRTRSIHFWSQNWNQMDSTKPLCGTTLRS